MLESKSFDRETITREAYVVLVGKFVQRRIGENPRLIILGFEDIRQLLKDYFTQRNIKFLEVEALEKLEEPFLLRESSYKSCVITADRRNIGKYASLVTSFKVLDETLPFAEFQEGTRDLYFLTDIADFSVDESLLTELCASIAKRMSASFKGDCKTIEIILDEILKEMKRYPSYFEVSQPKRIVEALVESVAELNRSGSVSVGFFLRKLGVEPVNELDAAPLFERPRDEDDFRKQITDLFVRYRKVLRTYVSCAVSSQRKNVAKLGLNVLQMMLCSLARIELDQSMDPSRWDAVLCLSEFERRVLVRVGKGLREQRKYDVDEVEAQVYERSETSGLPISFRFAILTKPAPQGSQSLIEQFYGKKLLELLGRYKRLPGSFPIDLQIESYLDKYDKLILRCTLATNKKLTLDIFEESARVGRHIAALLERVGRVKA